jgi:hypothetical protein
MAKKSGAKKTFNAKAKSIGPSGAWTMMQIPFDVEKEWGKPRACFRSRRDQWIRISHLDIP